MPSTIYFLGQAPLIKQVATATFATYDAATTRTITIGGVAISHVDATDLTTSLAALATLLNAGLVGGTAHPYFTSIVWTSDATHIIGTAGTYGVPFVFAGSVSGGTGTVSNAYAVTTANSGPQSAQPTSNYSTGALPVNGDTLIIENTATPLLWDIDILSGVTLALLDFRSGHSGKVGLPTNAFTTSADGSSYNTGYAEYRNTWYQAPATLMYCASSSQRLKWDAGSVLTTATIAGTATSAFESNMKAIRIKGSNANNVINISKGNIAIAGDVPGETATVLTLNVSFTTAASKTTDVSLSIGAGTTLTTLSKVAGTVVLNCAATTVNASGGILTTAGSGAITTMNVDNDAIVYHGSSGALTTLNAIDQCFVYNLSSGTITNTNVGATATYDCSRDARAKTFSNMNAYGNSSLNFDTGIASITFTNGIIRNKMDLSDFTLLKAGKHSITMTYA